MTLKVRLSDIKIAELNTDTVLLITKFLRKARSHDGFDLHMQQPNMLKELIQFAQNCEDPDLIVLCMKIKKSIASHIKGIDPERKSFNMYH